MRKIILKNKDAKMIIKGIDKDRFTYSIVGNWIEKDRVRKAELYGDMLKFASMIKWRYGLVCTKWEGF